MCRATDLVYDVTCLDVDGDINPGARIGSRSIVHCGRWRPITLRNIHWELQSHVVPQAFIQEIHHELHGVESYSDGTKFRSNTHCQMGRYPRGGRNRAD